MKYKNLHHRSGSSLALVVGALGLFHFTHAHAQSGRTALEEIVVTAQKRAESLQDAPIAISALDSGELAIKGVSGLGDLRMGDIPYLQVSGYAGSNKQLLLAMRGVAPSDASPATRESPVAVYVDDVYYGRPQALGTDLIEMERIEVLRGPQGQLFGRNAMGGAVRMVTKKPTGELAFQQTLGIANYGAWKSISRLNLPDWKGLKVKAEFMLSASDGWIKNPAPDQHDFNETDFGGGRLSALWDISDVFTLEYAYDNSKYESTNTYYHLINKDFNDPQGQQVNNFPLERGRQSRSRFPISLEPGKNDQQGHALTLNWQMNDALTFKSITAYREMTDTNWANFGGLFAGVPGVVPGVTLLGTLSLDRVEQEQFTQEFQLLGNTERLNWVVGLFYFDEDVKDLRRNAEFPNGVPASITDPFTFDVNDVFIIDPQISFTGGNPNISRASAKSKAAFFQGTWTPPVLNDKLQITVGLRYSKDEKDGVRNPDYFDPSLQSQATFDYEETSFDPAVTLDYQWMDNLSTYLRWANGYVGGGANIRSANFGVFDSATAESYEFGLKSEFWDRRARLNLAIYDVEYKDFQTDYSTSIPSITETINNSNPLPVKGVEMELTVIPLPGLTLSYSHSYMDANDRLIDFNPFANATNKFRNTYLPKNSGAFSATYEFEPSSMGALTANVSYNWTDNYYTTPFPQALDEPDVVESLSTIKYGIWNARLTLNEIPIGGDNTLKVSAWVKNLADEDYWDWILYVVNGFTTVGMPGAPRTYGLDVTFDF